MASVEKIKTAVGKNDLFIPVFEFASDVNKVGKFFKFFIHRSLSLLFALDKSQVNQPRQLFTTRPD